MVVNWFEILGVIWAASILSFVFKPNPIHRIVESLFIGFSAGYVLVANFENAYVSGIARIPQNYLLVVPVTLGVLMYFRLFEKYAWVSRYPIAFLTALGVGLSSSKIVQTDILQQIISTALPLIVPTSAIESISNIIIGVAVVTVISYFFYTRGRKGVLGISAKIGLAFLMMAFGASMAIGIMSRVNLLVTPLKRLVLVPSSVYILPIMLVIIVLSIYPEKIGLKKKHK